MAATTSSASVGEDGSVEIEDPNIDDLTAIVKRTFTEAGPQGGNWNETIQLIRKIPGSDKAVDVLLIEARCHEMMGNHKNALSAAGRLVQKAANHEPWVNGSPRMMAATLGANAAMQLGLSDNALSFYQTVLKFDPEQARARKQYRGLKKVVKLMNKAEEQVSTLCICCVLIRTIGLNRVCYSRYKKATTRSLRGLSTTASPRCRGLMWTRHSFVARYN